MKLNIYRALTFLILVGFAQHLSAEVIAVEHTEGMFRGFLRLKSADGKIVARGDATQTSHDGKVTTQTVFHYKDGSIHDETAVFTQNKTFQLLTYHLIQKGPTFPQQMDFSFDTTTGNVTVKYQDKDKKPETIEQKMELPPDLANGMVATLLKNIPRVTTLSTVSMLVTTPKPFLIKLKLSRGGETTFTADGPPQPASRFDVHVDIGGLIGVVVKLIGKQPPDTHVWMVEGKIPGVIGSEGPLYPDGPIWRVELASPVWPKTVDASKN